MNPAACDLDHDLALALPRAQRSETRLSKQIAHDIGIAEATVKVHRSRVMPKMKAGSLPELGRMVDRLKLVADKPRRS